MATEDGSVKIKVNMDITDVGAGVTDIAGQLKRVNVAAGNASETLKSALVNAVDAATGKSVQGKIFSLGSKLAALGPTFQKALAGNKAAVNDFQAKTADIAESITRLWNGLKQLGDVQYASPELDAMNTDIAEADKKAQELSETMHSLQEDGHTLKNSEQLRQTVQELQAAEDSLQELKSKRDELIKSGGLLSFKDSAEFQGMAASLDVVSGRMTGMQERLVEAAINAAAARREIEAAAAAEAAAQEEAARLEDDAAADHLEEIAQSAQVSSQAVIRLTQELEQLQARQQELNAAGVGMGYAEYDANAERIRAVTAALREYSETGSDVNARALTQTTAWERFRQKILGAAASMGLVRKQTDDTSGAMKRLRSGAETAASGMGSMFKNMLKWGFGIGSVTLLVRKLWTAVREGLTTMAQHDTETANTLNGLKTALTNVKLSLATAFGPVLTAVAPLLIKLSDLVTRAANAVARFFAILSGKSTYKKAVAAQDAITDSVAGTGEAAKEAAKNLSGLDELNTWQENKAGSGGGSGSAGGGAGVDMEEVETGAATDFEVRLKDILFNWDDLNPELIAEKILTGLCAAAGGIIGWTIGGPLGGLVGLTLGALLGVNLSQLTFDGDGTINPEETKKLILDALGGFIGSVLGYFITGKAKGAVIGFSIGAAATAYFIKDGGFLFDENGTMKADAAKKLILDALGGFIGAVLGYYATGSVKGAAIGFSIGAAATAYFTQDGGFLFDENGKMKKDAAEKLILDALGGFIGAVLGYCITKSGRGASIGFTIGALATAYFTKNGGFLFDESGKMNGAAAEKLILDALGGFIGAVLGYCITGRVKGAAIGFSIGAFASAYFTKNGGFLFDESGKMNSAAAEKLVLGAVIGMLAGALLATIVPGGFKKAAFGLGFTIGFSVTMMGMNIDWDTARFGNTDTLNELAEDNKTDELIEYLHKQMQIQDGINMMDPNYLNNRNEEKTMASYLEQMEERGQLSYEAIEKFVGMSYKEGEKRNALIEALAEEFGLGGFGGTGPDKLRSPFQMDMDIHGRVTDIEDGVPKKKKIINKAKVKVQELLDKIPDEEKTVGGIFSVEVENDSDLWWKDVKKWWGGKVGPVQPFTTSVTNSASAWWSSVKSWWGGKVGPVQPFTTSVTNSASTWWDNVENWWSGEVGPVQPFTTSVTNSASTWWSNVKSWWGGKVGPVQPFTTSVTNGASTWWSNVKTWWSGKVGAVKSFTTSVTNGSKTWWSNVKTWWSGKVGSVKSFTTSVVNSASTWWSNVKSWWGEKSKDGVTFSAKATSFVDAIQDKTITVKARISEIVSSAASKVRSWLGLATGGIYKNGRWEPIEGYASGGSPRSARLFYANENGMPELIGRIGSSTAVMNNGQIVASVAAGVYRAVAAAFSRLGGWFSAMTARLGDIPPAIEMLANMPRQIPQPVMATGTVLPPRAVYADGPVQGLADAVSGLREALDRQSPDRSGTGQEPTYNVNLNVDGQTLCRIVLREGRLRQLQSGGNPFMDLMGG